MKSKRVQYIPRDVICRAAERASAMHMDDIGDRRLLEACHSLIAVALLFDAANWPISTNDGVGGRGKPGSRHPGREQCPDAVRFFLKLAEKAESKWGEVAERGRPHRDMTKAEKEILTAALERVKILDKARRMGVIE